MAALGLGWGDEVTNNPRTNLTPAGLLMEGGYTQIPDVRDDECDSDVTTVGPAHVFQSWLATM
jgi:hypothetical protein